MYKPFYQQQSLCCFCERVCYIKIAGTRDVKAKPKINQKVTGVSAERESISPFDFAGITSI